MYVCGWDDMVGRMGVYFTTGFTAFACTYVRTPQCGVIMLLQVLHRHSVHTLKLYVRTYHVHAYGTFHKKTERRRVVDRLSTPSRSTVGQRSVSGQSAVGQRSVNSQSPGRVNVNTYVIIIK